MAVDPFHAAGNAFFASLQALTRETTATSYPTFEYVLGLSLAMLSLAQLPRKGWYGRQSRGQARVVNDMLQAVGRVKSDLPPAKSRSGNLTARDIFRAGPY